MFSGKRQLTEHTGDTSTDYSGSDDEKVIATVSGARCSEVLIELANVMEDAAVSGGWGYVREAEAYIASIVGPSSVVTLAVVERAAASAWVKRNGVVHQQLLELVTTGDISRISDILMGRSKSAKRRPCWASSVASARARGLAGW